MGVQGGRPRRQGIFTSLRSRTADPEANARQSPESHIPDPEASARYLPEGHNADPVVIAHQNQNIPPVIGRSTRTHTHTPPSRHPTDLLN